MNVFQTTKVWNLILDIVKDVKRSDELKKLGMDGTLTFYEGGSFILPSLNGASQISFPFP